MGWARSRKPHESNGGTDGIDLLGFAFNVPTRHDLRRYRETADRNRTSLASYSADYDSPDDYDNDDSDGASSLDTDLEEENLKPCVLYVPTKPGSTGQCSARQKAPKKTIRHRSPQRGSPEHLKGVSREEKPILASSKPRLKKQTARCHKEAMRSASRRRTSSSPKSEASSATDAPRPAKVASADPTFCPTFPITPQNQASSSQPVSFLAPMLQSPPVPQGSAAMYHSLPVNHVVASPAQPLYFAPPGFFTTQYVTPSSQGMSNTRSGSSLDNIQRLQSEINNLEQSQLRLKKEAHATELKKLHDELNATLDAATLQVDGPEDIRSRAEPACGRRTYSQDPSDSRDALDVTGSSTMKTLETAHPLQHHLCSNCGNIRSLRFHEKHPLRPGQKAVINYCESCRLTRVETNRTELYHFCFGCGRARSKVYQDAHPMVEGHPLSPNYCRKCVAEMQHDVGAANPSAVEAHPAGAPLKMQMPANSFDKGPGYMSCHGRKQRTSKYRQPFIEDSSTITPDPDTTTRKEALCTQRESSQMPGKEPPRRSSLRSEGSSGHSSSSKTVSFDFDTIDHPVVEQRGGKGSQAPILNTGKPKRESLSRKTPTPCSSTSDQVGNENLKSPGKGRARRQRSSSNYSDAARTPSAVPHIGGTSRVRSAFAGMLFGQRNQFGPPPSREGAPDVDPPSLAQMDGLHIFESENETTAPRFNSSPGAFSRRAMHSQAQHPEYGDTFDLNASDHAASGAPESQ
jgi:hypothetical protein